MEADRHLNGQAMQTCHNMRQTMVRAVVEAEEVIYLRVIAVVLAAVIHHKIMGAGEAVNTTISKMILNKVILETQVPPNSNHRHRPRPNIPLLRRLLRETLHLLPTRRKFQRHPALPLLQNQRLRL